MVSQCEECQYYAYDEDYEVFYRNGELWLGIPPHEHTMSTDCHMSETEDDPNVKFEIPIGSAEDLSSYMSNGSLRAGNYVLKADVTYEGTITVPSGVVNLCLNGHTLTTDRIHISSSSAAVNICDCSGADGSEPKGKIINRPGQNLNYAAIASISGIIYNTIYNQGTLRLYGGTIQCDSAAAEKACGIINQGSKMELSIYGGTVYLNGGGSSYDQHVIWVHQNAVLNLYGGAIEGTGSNKESSLKGITALGWDSYINLYDGKISLSGGAELTGVFVSGSGPLLTMSGGTIDIKRNTTTQTPNSAASFGIPNYYKTEITGGTIEGADIGVWNAYYTSSGYCKVSGTAVIRGIAAGIRNSAPLTVDGGSISGKYGIYYGGASTVKAATVSGGVITGTDTGIYCYAKAALTVNGGEISGKCRGIEISTTTASLTMTGGSVASEGTGVLNSGTTTVRGGTIDAGDYGKQYSQHPVDDRYGLPLDSF